MVYLVPCLLSDEKRNSPARWTLTVQVKGNYGRMQPTRPAGVKGEERWSRGDSVRGSPTGHTKRTTTERFEIIHKLWTDALYSLFRDLLRRLLQKSSFRRQHGP